MRSGAASALAIVPDSRAGARFRLWQGLTLALLIAGYSGYYFCRSNLSVTLPMIVAGMVRDGADPATAQVRLGTIASLGVLAYALGKFPSGALADFLGGKRNFLAGMAGAVLFTLWFASGRSVSVFALAWIGNRFVQSLGWAGIVKITSKWFSYKSYGTAMAAVSMSYLFGDAIARNFLASLIAGQMNWRGIFVAAAAILASILAVCLLLLRESPTDMGLPEPPANPSNLFARDGDPVAPAGLRSLLRPLLRSKTFWLVCALSAGTTLVREAFGLWTPSYFIQVAGFTPAEAAGKSALFPFLGGVSVLLCGWLSDRLGPRSRAGLMCAGLALSGVVLLWLAVGHLSRSATVALVSLVAFLVIGPYSFLAGAMSLDFGGKQGAATASGVIDGVGYLGGALAGDAMARISVTFGWSGFFAVLAGVSILTSAAAAIHWIQEQRRRL